MRPILFFAVMVFLACPANAEVFRYFDRDGTLIISDDPHLKRPVEDRAEELHCEEVLSYEYYPVSGRNLQEMVSSVSKGGPFDAKEGRNFPGQTRWKLSWSYSFGYTHRIDSTTLHAMVNISDVILRSELTVVLPEVSGDTELSTEEQKHWEDFAQRLLSHELDHVKIVNDALCRDDARRAFYEIKELTLPYESGQDTDRAVKTAVELSASKAGGLLTEKIEVLNEEYDRLTEHGQRPEMREEFFKKL